MKQITQTLRERHRLITYNRSDCQYLSDEQHGDAPQVLAAVATTLPDFKDWVKDSHTKIKSRAFNSKHVSAHHAIIPTATSTQLSQLTQSEANVYQLIAKQYLAQFYPKHEYRETHVMVHCEDHCFKAVSKISLDLGWKVLFDDQKIIQNPVD